MQLTDDERFSLIISYVGGIPAFGVPRLGVPALRSQDSSMGVTNPGYRPDDEGATAFPSSILVAASFDPSIARRSGGGTR